MQNATPKRPRGLAPLTRWLARLAARLRSRLVDDTTDAELERQICAWDADVINRGSAWRKN